jgi:hypothetical protein
MKTQAKNKNQVNESSAEKNKTVKYALIFTIVIAIVFSAIWFGGELLASESVISTTAITINGKERLLKFSEKRSGSGRNQNAYKNNLETGVRHYAYYLELSDAASHNSLNKLRFKSPVMKIPSAPVLIAGDHGIAWVVSTSRSAADENKGFILKFSLSDESIQVMDFDIDDKYRIQEVEGDKVYVSDGTGPYTSNHSMYGGIYLDLKTEKIVDGRKGIR